MTTETLSDKVTKAKQIGGTYFNAYSEEDVREFIKKLKDRFSNNFLFGRYSVVMNEIIDELAGEKLI